MGLHGNGKKQCLIDSNASSIDIGHATGAAATAAAAAGAAAAAAATTVTATATAGAATIAAAAAASRGTHFYISQFVWVCFGCVSNRPSPRI